MEVSKNKVDALTIADPAVRARRGCDRMQIGANEMLFACAGCKGSRTLRLPG
jgi:hypothetical protein